MVEGIRELIELQHEVSRALQRQVKSLDLYRTRDGGFTHRRRASPEASNELSKASTATCVISLVDSGKWNRSKDETNSLLDDLLLGERTSAGLPSENAFTVGFLAESCAKLFPPLH
jgi:hypothetical protein